MRSLLFLTIISFGLSLSAEAQTEFKLNPVFLLFGGFLASCEQPITDQFGVEGELWAAPDLGVAGFGLAKYYFKPKMGADNFYAGAFLGVGEFGNNSVNLGIGFHVGYKVLAKKGLLLELNLGAGRALNAGGSNFVPHFKVDLGYRIGKKDLYDME